MKRHVFNLTLLVTCVALFDSLAIAQEAKEQFTLRGHPDGVTGVAFSPDGKQIVSGSSGERSVILWDAATGKEILSLKPQAAAVRSVAFSPDGKRIVSGGDAEEETKPAELRVWDSATGKELLSLSGHTTGISSVAFSPDEKRIVSGGWDKAVKVWDIATDE